MIEKVIHFADNGDGCELALRQRFDSAKLKKDRRPVLIVPGYGMNSFIFGFHPKSLSYEEYLASCGFEVWSMDFRNNGQSRPSGKPTRNKKYGMKELATIDLRAALDFVASHTQSTDKSGKVDCLGCSLAGSIICAHIVLDKGNRVGSFVSLGAPLRWVDVPALLQLAFASKFIASRLRLKNTRELSGLMLPLATKFPNLLDMYMHKSHVDVSMAGEFTRTVEDPVPEINEELVDWLRSRDLIIGGVNICNGMREFKGPFLAVIANADGIVPPKNVTATLEMVGSEVKDTLTVGTSEIPFAHADLFVSNHAEQMHFAHVAEWLEARYPKKAKKSAAPKAKAQ